MFQGSDVDGLDRIVARMNDAAAFADKLVVVLKALAAAMEAMSWTGWCAAFARYLRAVVIPWVQSVSRYLKGFARVLAAISSVQRVTSNDSPTVHIPAAVFQPTPMPTLSAANGPLLSAPDTTVVPSQPGGGAGGGGAQVVVPVSIGSITVHTTGASGAGAEVTAPVVLPVVGAAPGPSLGAAGTATGAGGAVGSLAGTIAGGLLRDPVGTAGQVVGGVVGGAVGHALGGGSLGERVGAAVADHVAERLTAPTGGAGSPTGGSGVPVGAPGPVAPMGADALLGGTPGGTPDGVSSGVAGDPPVAVTTAAGALGAPSIPDAARAPVLAAVQEPDGGTPVALAAAPLGLGALGAATLGALRSGVAAGGDGDGDGDGEAPEGGAAEPLVVADVSGTDAWAGGAASPASGLGDAAADQGVSTAEAR
ncbi:hypothetical protein DNL40_15885 [Xylanimonas oleitrophica]|uniref:Glycine zipper domain-containing protein n=1 Tax=Xylanimonas oleitrophica TaxID=2607479 RepID=A0A2W5WKI9_9MICO|nr:hypothetical protein [Xylanimonas oleitrophica]PZR51572.1 hypothetical protein DNL40_15885 [Xylanimonas oleitrophica]